MDKINIQQLHLSRLHSKFFFALPFEIHFCEKRFKHPVCLIYNHINNVST